MMAHNSPANRSGTAHPIEHLRPHRRVEVPGKNDRAGDSTQNFVQLCPQGAAVPVAVHADGGEAKSDGLDSRREHVAAREDKGLGSKHAPSIRAHQHRDSARTTRARANSRHELPAAPLSPDGAQAASPSPGTLLACPGGRTRRPIRPAGVGRQRR